MVLLIKFYLVLLVNWFVYTNKNKGLSNFDIKYNDCKSNHCVKRQSDENCIFKCVSEICYEEVLENHLFELGEINYDLKSRFERCFNFKKKKI
jgi:hypothetical protein